MLAIIVGYEKHLHMCVVHLVKCFGRFVQRRQARLNDFLSSNACGFVNAVAQHASMKGGVYIQHVLYTFF